MKRLLMVVIFMIGTIVPVVLAEPISPSDGASKFTEIISNIIKTVEQTTIQFANMVLRASMAVIGALYAPLAVVGIVLYVTHVNRYLGRQLIIGALLLAFFVEFVLPAFIP